MLRALLQPLNGRVCRGFFLVMTLVLAGMEAGQAAQSTGDTFQLRKAAQYLKAGDQSKAEQILQMILKKRPDSPEALNLLGVIRGQQQHFEESEALFQRALRLNPRLSSAYVNLGTLYRQNNRPVLALSNFETAAKVFPLNPEILRNLALLYADRGDFSGAAKALQTIPVKMRPPDYWDLLARFYVTAGDFAKAEESLRQVLMQKPDSISTLQQLAGVSLKRGDSQRAWQYLAEAVRLAPNSPDLLYEFAQ